MRLMICEILSSTSSLLPQAGDGFTITPAMTVTMVLLLPVVMGLLLVLIIRERVKERNRQVPPIPPGYYRAAAPPLPTKRSTKGPPDLPRGY